MRKLLSMLVMIASLAHAQAPQTYRPLDPKLDSLFPSWPTNYLTDVAGIVKNPDAVNARLKAIRTIDSLSLVVVTLPSIKDRDIADVAREILRKWKVATANDTLGAAVRNTGGVILLVPSIRKCRVETATGSEAYMTDYRAAEACRAARSHFQAGNFGDGFILIANQFADAHRASMTAAAAARLPKPPATPSEPFPWGTVLVFLGAAAIIGAYFWRRAYLLEQERQRQEAIDRAARERLVVEERRRQQAENAERERLAAIRRAEQIAAEKKRWDSLTPAQQKKELAEREREQQEAARKAAIEAEARRKRDAEEAARRAVRDAEDAVRRRRQDEEDSLRRSTYSSYNDSSSSSSSSSDSSWSSGGSSDAGGGGGGSDY